MTIQELEKATQRHFVVIVTIKDPITGRVIIDKVHECSDILTAKARFADCSEACEIMSEFLPGLSVSAFETTEVYSLTPAGHSALEKLAEVSRAGTAHDARWWAAAIGQIK